jgi:beta-barrel assembly-enhancing protease
VETPSFTGRYSDGRTAAAHVVIVRLGSDLEISGPGLAVTEHWTYAKLHSAAPLHWKDNEVLLRSPDRSGATLFVANPGFASAILKLSPRLSARAHRWRYAAPGLSIVAALLALVAGMYIFNWQPAKTIAGLIPHTVRVAIGEKAAESLAGAHSVCSSPDGNAALSELVAKLSAAAGNGNAFHVQAVHWDIINAFAVPGEQIVVSGNLIQEADSPDEVAGVIAHEMGHGIELHPEAGIVRSLGLSAIIELFAAGQSGTLTNAGALLLELHYSREAENQADLHAMRILKNANISPRPLSVFFKRLLKIENAGAGASDTTDDTTPADTKDGGKAAGETVAGKTSDSGAGNRKTVIPPPNVSIFATHPPTPERAKMAEDAATYPGEASLSPESWQALKHICD